MTTTSLGVTEGSGTSSRRTAVVDAARGFAVLVCAVSAGIHAGLVPEHLREASPLGVAFAVDAVLLAVAAFALRDPRWSARSAGPAAVLLLATALAYVVSRTAGLPLLQSEPEPVDWLGTTVTLLEVAGAIACGLLITRKDHR